MKLPTSIFYRLAGRYWALDRSYAPFLFMSSWFSEMKYIPIFASNKLRSRKVLIATSIHRHRIALVKYIKPMWIHWHSTVVANAMEWSYGGLLDGKVHSCWISGLAIFILVEYNFLNAFLRFGSGKVRAYAEKKQNDFDQDHHIN